MRPLLRLTLSALSLLGLSTTAYAERTMTSAPAGFARPQLPPAGSATSDPSRFAIPHVSSPVQWRGVSYTRHNEERNGAHVVLLRDARGREVWSTTVPKTALALVEDLVVLHEEVPVRGQAPLLEIRFEGKGLGGSPIAYRIFLTQESRGQAPITVWQGRESEGETGDTFHIRDLDGDGKDEIVLFAQTPAVRFCGQEQTPLFPRVWDPKTQSFRLISLRLPIRAGTPTLPVLAEAPSDRWDNDANLQAVSSNERRTVVRSYGNAPAVLHDGDLSTAWFDNAPGRGIGTFVSATVHPMAGLAGIAYAHPESSTDRATSVMISVEDGRAFLADLPPNQRQGYIPLPEVMASSCVTLAVLDAHPRAQRIGFAELHVHTGLDVMPFEEAINARIVRPYLEAEDTIARTRIAQLVVVNDDTVVAAAIQVLQDVEPAAQGPLVDALLRTEKGRAGVYDLLVRGKLSATAVAAVGRSLNRGAGVGVDQLYDLLGRSNDDEARIALIRVISRTVSGQDALRLLPVLATAPANSRTDLAFGLGQAQFTDIDTLLLELRGEPAKDLVVLRAVSRIARRQAGRTRPPLSPEAVEKLAAALDDDNGTVARVAFQLAGILGVDSLRPRLQIALEKDPHSAIRLAALKGISAYDAHFAEAAGDSVLLIDLLEDNDPSVRITAAQLLRDRQLSETEINYVFQALRREVWSEASRSLVVALIRQNRSDIDIRLAETLQHVDVSLDRTAFITWQARQRPAPLAALERMEQRARPNETNFIAWTRSIARIQSPTAAALLHRVFQDQHLPIRSRAAVLEAMGRQRQVESIALLIDTLENSGSVDHRRAAARGLAWFEQRPDVRSALNAALDAERNETVLSAIQSALRALDLGQTTREILLHE